MIQNRQASLIRYSRLRVTSWQRRELERAFTLLLNEGGEVSYRDVQQGFFSTVYYGLVLTGNAAQVESIVNLIEEFRV